MKDQIGTIYILRMTPDLAHARYYVGWTSRTAEIRLVEHLRGYGCPMIAHAHRSGRRVEIIATMAGTRTDERKIKNRKNTKKLVAQLERKGLLRRQLQHAASVPDDVIF
jgi:hypothetical protein